MMNQSTLQQTKQTPWNKGKLSGQKRPLKLQEIRAIRIRLQLQERTRERALFNLAIDSKLRACDLMALTVGEIAQAWRVQCRALIVQKKTGRPVQFVITEQTRQSIQSWIEKAQLRPPDYLFPSRVNSFPHLTRRQYVRIVDRWVSEIGLDPALYGTHTLRRTKASLIYRRTKNNRAVQLLLGHTKLESTVRYLGIDLDDALELSDQTEV
jgi:integrase